MSKKKDGRKSKDKKVKDREDIPDFAEIARLLTQAARSLRTELSSRLLEAGLYAGQDQVIRLLADDDGMTTGLLAQKTGVKAPTMTRTIGRLEAQGFVTRRGDERDQRLSKVYLTETGRATLELIDRSTDACGALALDGFSGKDMRNLARLLDALDSNLGAHPGED